MRSQLLALVVLSACTHVQVSPSATLAPAHARLFVSNEVSNDVSEIDLTTGTVVRTLPVGKRPRALKLSPDHTTLYVAVSGSPRSPPGSTAPTPPPDHTADGVAVVDLATGKLLRTLSAGEDPEGLDLTPDGKILIVSNEEAAEATLLDPIAGARLGTVQTGAEPEGVRVRPDGKIAYVTSEDEGTVTVIDLTSHAAIASFAAGQRPRAAAFTSDGALAFVSGEASRTVTFVDGQTHRVLETLHLDGALTKPMGVAVAPDDRTLFVTTGRGGAVAIIDVATRKVTSLLPVGARPWGIAITRDGKTLFTANGPTNDVSVIDVATHAIRHFPAGESPWGVIVDDGVKRGTP